MTPFIRIISQTKKYIEAGGEPVTARPPALQRSFFVLHKNRTKNRFLTTGPGSRAANVVHLYPALPGPGHQEAGCKNLLCVRLLERFRFHDETKVNGWDFFSSVNLSSVEWNPSLHLLFFICILSKRVKRPLVAYTNEVYRHRWFFHLRTTPIKIVLSASGKVTGAFFSSGSYRSSFLIGIIMYSPTIIYIR